MKMPLYKTLLLLIFCFGWFVAKTQTGSPKIDSLKKVLLEEKDDTSKVKTLYYLGLAYYNSDYEKSLQYAKNALALAQKINFTGFIG